VLWPALKRCANTETLWNRYKAPLSNFAGVQRDPLVNLIQKEANREVENAKSLNGNRLKRHIHYLLSVSEYYCY